MTHTEKLLSQLHERIRRGDVEAEKELQADFARPLERIVRRQMERSGPARFAAMKLTRKDNEPSPMNPDHIVGLLRALARHAAKPEFNETMAIQPSPTVHA